MEFVKLLFGNFFEVLSRLLGGYLGAGWPFAAMHVIVLYFVLYSSWFKKIRTETRALESWESDRSSTRKGETTPVLDRFVEDSEALGPQGILVPITDYSDRLDSSVDGMVSELHDRINLFLLVGIAGSLFGLFEFAFRAYDALTSSSVGDNDRIRLLGEYLSLSMSKAFPVGFVGLVLTFFFQLLAGFPERHLRESLSVATRKALSRRRDVSKSQVTVIQETSEAIRKSLLPLSDLKDTLTQSIQPVVKEFGTRLDQSLGLVKTQFDEVQKTTASLKTAVESVNTGVASLNTAAHSLRNLLRDAPNVLANAEKLQETQMAVAQDFEKMLEAYVAQAGQLNLAVNDTLGKLATLPGDVIREAKVMLDGLGKDSLSAWRDSSKEIYELISHDYGNLFDDISLRAEKIQSQVTLVAKDLIAVTEGLEKTVKGLADLPAGIESELKTTFGDIGTVSKNVWVTKSNEFAQDTQKEYVNYLGKIQQQAEEASAKLKEGGEEFRRVAGNWESLLKEPVDKLIKEAKESIEAELKRLDGALVERYPQVSAKIETFNKSLETMLVQVQSIQAALALWLQEADKAQKQVRVIHEGMVVADLLNNNTEHVKTANQLLTNIQRQMPASGGDGLQTELALMRGLLMDIKNGIATMASRKPQPKPQPPPPEPEKGLWGRLKDKLRGRS